VAPFLILVSCWLSFGVAGRLGVPWFDSPAKAGRAALAVMFVFTGLTHFTPMKHDYLAMLPAALPSHLGLIRERRPWRNPVSWCTRHVVVAACPDSTGVYRQCVVVRGAL
jgi:hypothetical protein